MSFIKNLPSDNKQHNSVEKNELIELIFNNSDKDNFETIDNTHFDNNDNHTDDHTLHNSLNDGQNLENYNLYNSKNNNEKKYESY